MRKGVLLVVILLIISIPVAYSNANRVLEGIVSEQLEKLGILNAKLSIAELSIQKITFSGVSIGEHLRIPSLNVSFDWSELLSGEIDRIRIDGLHLTVKKEGERFSFGDLDSLIYVQDTPETANDTPSSTSEAIQWPVRQFDLQNARITLEDPDNPIEIRLKGYVHKNELNDIQVENAEISVIHTAIETSAEVQATLQENGDLKADLILRDGKLTLEPLTGLIDGGNVQVAGNLNAFQSFQIKSHIGLSSLELVSGLSVPAQLEAEINGSDMNLAFSIPENVTGLRGQIAINTEQRKNDIELSFLSELQSHDLTKLPRIEGLPEQLQGTTNLRVQFHHRLDDIIDLVDLGSPWAIIHNMPSTTLEVETDGVAISPTALSVRSYGIWEILGNGDRLEIYERVPFDLKLNEAFAGQYQQLFPALYNAKNDGPLSVLLLRKDQAPLITLQGSQEIMDFHVNSEIDFAGGGLSASSGYLDASFSLISNTFELEKFNIQSLDIESEDWSIAHKNIRKPSIGLQISGRPEKYEGEIKIAGGFDGELAPEIEVLRSDLDMKLSIEGSDKYLKAAIPDCSMLKIGEIRLENSNATLDSQELCLTSEQNSLFEYHHSEEASDYVQSQYLMMKLPERLIRLTLEDGHRIATGGKGSQLSFNGITRVDKQDFSFDGDWRLSGILNHVISSDLRIQAKKLELDVHSELAKGKTDVDIRVQEIAHVQSPSFFTDLSAHFHANVLGEKAEYKGTLGFLNKQMNVGFDGHYNLGNKTGRGTFRFDPITLDEGKKELKDLSPFAAQYFRYFKGSLLAVASVEMNDQKNCLRSDLNFRKYKLETSSQAYIAGSPLELFGGQVGMILNACDDEGQLRTTGTVLIENANGDFNSIKVRKVNTAIDFGSLWPLATKGDQKLSIGAINMGIPLTDGQFDFRVDDLNAILIKEISFLLADGKVSTNDINIRNNELGGPLTLKVDGVQLETLLTSINISGISGEGVLDGNIPISLSEDRPKIKKGILKSRNGGILRYVRDTEEEGAAALVYEALSNFHYEYLNLELDDDESNQLGIRLKAKGGNPDFFDGYPVELDIGLNGNLEAILKDSLTAYRVPDAIRNRMLKYGN